MDIVSIEMILRKSAITRNGSCDCTAKREDFVLRWVILRMLIYLQELSIRERENYGLGGKEQHCLSKILE